MIWQVFFLHIAIKGTDFFLFSVILERLRATGRCVVSIILFRQHVDLCRTCCHETFFRDDVQVQTASAFSEAISNVFCCSVLLTVDKKGEEKKNAGEI